MLNQNHFHLSVIFLILINTHLSEGFEIGSAEHMKFLVIMMSILGVMILAICCCLCCIPCCKGTGIPIPPEEPPPPPYYPRNQTVNVNPVQNQATYNCETLPQPVPNFEGPKNGTALSPNPMLSSLSPLSPPLYSENLNGEWINGTWVQHA